MDLALPQLLAFGASTPVGRCMWSSAAAVRAGISSFAEHEEAIDTEGEPVRHAPAPWLDPAADIVERMAALLAPAIAQSLDQADLDPARLAFALALPEPRPGLPDDLTRVLMRQLPHESIMRFGATASFPNGHAAGLLALAAAARKIQRNELDACVVAGVDSYVSEDTLAWLEDREQLHGAGPLNNAWGFVPGEAAGAVLLARPGLADTLGLQPLATLLGTCVHTEPCGPFSGKVCIGRGLSAVFAEAQQFLASNQKITDIYCDMNGEPYRAEEYGFACLRQGQSFTDAGDFTAPADCWGDVGAAGAILHLGLASVASRKAYARGSTAMVWASSESGSRAAAVLTTAA